ncbi:MAG: hypothetical protein K0S07_897 [Chlamydiales bacterium]|jgi:hypothetical protein|nr:hypothetical protein [Chlamydiales bacterium]
MMRLLILFLLFTQAAAAQTKESQPPMAQEKDAIYALIRPLLKEAAKDPLAHGWPKILDFGWRASGYPLSIEALIIGGPASKKGIRLKDRLIAANGYDISSLSTQSFENLIPSLTKQAPTLNLAIQRGQQVFTATIRGEWVLNIPIEIGPPRAGQKALFFFPHQVKKPGVIQQQAIAQIAALLIQAHERSSAHALQQELARQLLPSSQGPESSFQSDIQQEQRQVEQRLQRPEPVSLL